MEYEKSSSICGKVVVYKGRGRTLGYPTANIDVKESDQDGIYIGHVEVGADKYKALIFVGAAITFGEEQRFAEAYLLDFTGNLYGRDVCMHLLLRIRNVEKFQNAEALVAQIREDERQAREYFASH